MNSVHHDFTVSGFGLCEGERERKKGEMRTSRSKGKEVPVARVRYDAVIIEK